MNYGTWSNPSTGVSRPAAKASEPDWKAEAAYWKQMFLDLKAKYEPETNGKSETNVSLYDNQGRSLISQAEAARRLRVGRGQIHKWVEAKKLPAVRVEGRKAPMIVEAGLTRPSYERRRKGA